MLNVISKEWERIKDVNLGILVIVVQLFMLINPSVFFGKNPDEFQWVMMLYIAIFTVSMAIPDLRSMLFTTKVRDAFPKFIKHFLVTYFGVAILGTLFVSSNFSPLFNPFHLGFGIAMLDAFYTAVVEETFFRRVLPRYLGDHIVHFLFAIFHYTVYFGNIFAFVMMYVLSMFWLWLKRRTSKKTGVANIGSHAGWTLATRIFQDVVT